MLLQESEIEAQPLDRAHQDKLIRVGEEMMVISQHLEWQRLVFQVIRSRRPLHESSHHHDLGRNYTMRETVNTLNTSHSRSRNNSRYVPEHRPYGEAIINDDAVVIIHEELAKLAPTDEGGYHDLLIQDCLDIIETNLRNFDEMRTRTDYLKTHVRISCSVSKVVRADYG